MPSRPKTKINADGEVVRIGGDSKSNSERSLLLSSTSRSNLDVFGFNLEVRQFILVLGILSLMIGLTGVFLFLIVFGLYCLWNRFVPTSTSNYSNSSSTSGERAWGGNGGPRIKGVKDLPSDPKGC